MNKIFEQVRKELDARLPNKRFKTSTSWSNGELSTLIYGVVRLGEREFSDLMSQTIFMKPEF